MKTIAIIGSGPSALFAAKTILENSENLFLHIYERGHVPNNRVCPMDSSTCKLCKNCAVINGGGGAGLFSDGKLVLDLSSGGNALGIMGLSRNEQYSITETIRETLRSFDGVSEYKNTPSEEEQLSFSKKLSNYDLRIKYYDVMHMGTSNLARITQNFIEHLKVLYGDRLHFYFNTCVNNIKKSEKGGLIVCSSIGENAYSSVIAAVGKSGSEWLRTSLESLGCRFLSHDYYFGVRMETKATNIDEFIRYSFDPKIYRTTGQRKIKLHCVCRSGEVRLYNYKGMLFVGGHSPYTASNPMFSKIKTANFNVMISFNKSTIAPKELLGIVRKFSGGKVIAQRLGDFIAKRTTKEWGEIVPKQTDSLCTANLRELMDSIDPDFSPLFISFIDSLSEISNGINSPDNILYSPAIEWDMDAVDVDNHMETNQRNLFAIGDGAGISQGIVYSAATGIIAAQEIVTRYGNDGYK